MDLKRFDRACAAVLSPIATLCRLAESLIIFNADSCTREFGLKGDFGVMESTACGDSGRVRLKTVSLLQRIVTTVLRPATTFNRLKENVFSPLSRLQENLEMLRFRFQTSRSVEYQTILPKLTFNYDGVCFAEGATIFVRGHFFKPEDFRYARLGLKKIGSRVISYYECALEDIGDKIYFCSKIEESTSGYYSFFIQIVLNSKKIDLFLGQRLHVLPVKFCLDSPSVDLIANCREVVFGGWCFLPFKKISRIRIVLNAEGRSSSVALRYKIPRPDVYKVYRSGYSLKSGFSGLLTNVSSGRYQLTLEIITIFGTRYSLLLSHWLTLATGSIADRRGTDEKVNVISVLYNKENEVGYFLKAMERQIYCGRVEILFVNDKTPDRSVDTVRSFFYYSNPLKAKLFFETKIIENERNIGNCRSRNRALAVADGTFSLIIDADCLVSANLLERHAESYDKTGVDACMGFHNIETGCEPPLEVLSKYEDDLSLIYSRSELQDKVSLSSFVNCITRNFSIRNGLEIGALFDEEFSYSEAKNSGFGWEDVEMGYRLYQQGIRVLFLEDTFTVHVSHPSSVDERAKPYKSLRNFRKLHEKHPQLIRVARRWSVGTYQKIVEWMDSLRLAKNPDNVFVENHFQHFYPPKFFIGSKKDLRILTYRWHCPHQYELYKLPYSFDLVSDLGTGFTRSWDYEQRPMPLNAKFVSNNKINFKDYDLAMIHFDENILRHDNTNGVIGQDWGDNFRYFVNEVKLPKVAICHGTPQFYGQYGGEVDKDVLLKVIEESREHLREVVKDIVVVTNSHQAHREWGFSNSRVIWHGFDPAEFPLSKYRKGILTLGKSMVERPYYRGYELFQKTASYLDNRWSFDSLNVPRPTHLTPSTNLYAWVKFFNYVENIRQYSIYFNPTLRSPMPRSRGEAMMCGLTTVSADNHDVNMYIRNGFNGFYSNDPYELSEYLRYLLTNPDASQKIGAAGRQTAMDIFNHDRYLYNWEQMITELLGSGCRSQVS